MMMNLFLAQNKHQSKVHKENNIKIKNIEEYKKSLVAHCNKLGLTKKLVHDPIHATHNSCLVANINICKYRAN
jgi:uncharacterized membrane-anchored protein YhcB (DUF1043 family)